MKRSLLIALISATLGTQGYAGLIPGIPDIVFDPTNHGVNAANFEQLKNLYDTLDKYRQFVELSQGMFRCPVCFMQAAANATTAVESIMIEDGHWDPKDPATARKIANLNKIMSVGQMAAQQAQLASAMSTGNGAGVASLMFEMSQVAQQINAETQKLNQDAQVNFYAQHNGYTPQAKVISSWRLK